ncbi:MAG: RNA polymerase sigma factor [Kofleriaceae bacterium]
MVKLGKLLQLRPNGEAELGDAGLAAACATGDRTAQSMLFERHVDAVYRFIAQMRGADPQAVDDLVQATFIAAFQSIGTYRGPKLLSWLFGIATNILRSYVRKEISVKRVALALVAEPEPAAARGPLPELVQLREAVDRLPRKLREVIVLVDLEGREGSEVAEALRISESAVWRRLAAARAALREQLGGDA